MSRPNLAPDKEPQRNPRPPVVRGLVLLPVAGSLALLLLPLPPGWLGIWQGQLLDFGHVPLFAVLVLVLRVELGPSLWRPLLAAIALAAVVEIIQPWFGRKADGIDFLRGALGALAATAAICAGTARRRVVRIGFAALAVGLVAWPVVEVAPYFADTIEGQRAFPVLADFSTERELLRWECSQATLAPAADGTPGACEARLDFDPGPHEYPSAALRPAVADFRNYQWLCAEFRVDSPVEFAISVRTGMRAGDRTTHTDVSQTYAVGTHVARLNLTALALRGRPEPLNLADVRWVVFFTNRLQERRTLILRRVWLE